MRDVAFIVNDARQCYEYLMKHGGKSVSTPYEEPDADKSVVIAAVATYEDTVHTFIKRA